MTQEGCDLRHEKGVLRLLTTHVFKEIGLDLDESRAYWQHALVPVLHWIDTLQSRGSNSKQQMVLYAVNMVHVFQQIQVEETQRNMHCMHEIIKTLDKHAVFGTPGTLYTLFLVSLIESACGMLAPSRAQCLTIVIFLLRCSVGASFEMIMHVWNVLCCECREMMSPQNPTPHLCFMWATHKMIWLDLATDVLRLLHHGLTYQDTSCRVAVHHVTHTFENQRWTTLDFAQACLQQAPFFYSPPQDAYDSSSSPSNMSLATLSPRGSTSSGSTTSSGSMESEIAFMQTDSSSDNQITPILDQTFIAVSLSAPTVPTVEQRKEKDVPPNNSSVPAVKILTKQTTKNQNANSEAKSSVEGVLNRNDVFKQLMKELVQTVHIPWSKRRFTAKTKKFAHMRHCNKRDVGRSVHWKNEVAREHLLRDRAAVRKKFNDLVAKPMMHRVAKLKFDQRQKKNLLAEVRVFDKSKLIVADISGRLAKQSQALTEARWECAAFRVHHHKLLAIIQHEALCEAWKSILANKQRRGEAEAKLALQKATEEKWALLNKKARDDFTHVVNELNCAAKRERKKQTRKRQKDAKLEKQLHQKRLRRCTNRVVSMLKLRFTVRCYQLRARIQENIALRNALLKRVCHRRDETLKRMKSLQYQNEVELKQLAAKRADLEMEQFRMSIQGRKDLESMRLLRALFARITYSSFLCFNAMRQIDGSDWEIVSVYSHSLVTIANMNFLANARSEMYDIRFVLQHCLGLSQVARYTDFRTWIVSKPLLKKYVGLVSLLRPVPFLAFKFLQLLKKFPNSVLFELYPDSWGEKVNFETIHEDRMKDLVEVIKVKNGPDARLLLLATMTKGNLETATNLWIARDHQTTSLVRFLNFFQKGVLQCIAQGNVGCSRLKWRLVSHGEPEEDDNVAEDGVEPKEVVLHVNMGPNYENLNLVDWDNMTVSH